MKLKQREYYYKGSSGTIIKCYEPLTESTMALILYSNIFISSIGTETSGWDPDYFTAIKKYQIKNET